MNPTVSPLHRTRLLRRALPAAFAAAGLALLLLSSGCTTAATDPVPAGSDQPPAQVLQAGDIIRIAFPGANGMDATQQIRRDGKLNLNIVGEIDAAGKTPAQLEKELTQAYAPQLVNKEVKITVVSSSFSVFVTGAVMKPGKILPDHAMTAFEAIMEAGGFDYNTANTGAVRVIRNRGSETKTFTLDLKSVLEGKPSKPFYLQANDTIFVPQKFQLF